MFLPFLLCTDLDRTLIPNGSAPESPGARSLFAQLADRQQVTVIYVTGRHRTLIESAINHYQLPQPAFAIADVGSTIWRISRGHWIEFGLWNQVIDNDWRGLKTSEIQSLLPELPGLSLQEQEKQGRHKLSYYLSPQEDRELVHTNIAARLHQAGIHANLIWSVDEPTGFALLDILPANANKLHAINFLMQHLGFDYSNTLFAGDSGNDLDVLHSPIRAILVANADAEVRAAATRGDPARLYQATGGYLGMNGNYSAGILEGVAHFLPTVDHWLGKQR